MPMTQGTQNGSDTTMVNGVHKQDTTSSNSQKAKVEARTPVLLQWKDREIADDLSKLMMGSTRPEKGKAGAYGSDVEMEDR
jgi:hypothetical protein